MAYLSGLISYLLDRDEEGQGLAEYALILALIAIVAIVALIFLGGQVSDDSVEGRLVHLGRITETGRRGSSRRPVSRSIPCRSAAWRSATARGHGLAATAIIPRIVGPTRPALSKRRPPEASSSIGRSTWGETGPHRGRCRPLRGNARCPRDNPRLVRRILPFVPNGPSPFV